MKSRDYMRNIIITLTVLTISTAIASTSHATCGPTLKFDADARDNIGRDTGHTSAGISLSIPLSDIECRKTEATIAKTREQEREVKIRNLDKISRICRDNKDNPAFAQLCHVELPNLLADVIR